MKLTESVVTKKLLHHLLWERSFQIVTHQFDNYHGRSDVFWVNASMFTQEFEIKLTKADLMSELSIIKLLQEDWNPKTIKGISWTKYLKHLKYLDKKQHTGYGKSFIPNYFSYVIPQELVEIAKEYLKETPYGIISFRYKEWEHEWKPRVDIWSLESIKKVSSIHRDKIGDKELCKIAHRLSYVAQDLYCNQ